MSKLSADVDVASGADLLDESGPYDSGLILTRTPLRISFAGGGTDLAEFYARDYGAVFSTAIDRYVYVSVKRHSELFREPIRVNYSKTEMVTDVGDIENDIARECLRFMRIEPPVYISTIADVPACSGLGGSSAFAVGLLHALHAYRGERVSCGQLAEEASYIEVDVLHQPIGKQDQYAAAFGGLNLFRFQQDGTVSVEPQRGSKARLDEIFSNVMVFWTGIVREAGGVLAEQRRNTSAKYESLTCMRMHAQLLQSMASNGPIDFGKFGRILDESWSLKRQLASTISSSKIDEWYELAKQAGAEGGKICGAGGGGFLLLIAKPDRQPRIRAALHELREVRMHPEVYGSRVLLPYMR